MGTDDLPPSYESVFKQLSIKKTEANGVADYTQEAVVIVQKKASSGIGLCFCSSICSMLGLALPITEIVIGSLNLKDCPAERLLPIYLIVSGVFGIISGGACGGQSFASRKSSEEDVEASAEGENGGGAKKAGNCCSSLISLFVFAWFICGNVWVFTMDECDSTDSLASNSTNIGCFTKDTKFAGTDFYCKQLVYDFVFYESIAKWALFGLFIFVGLLVCCCACCAYCCTKGAAKDERSAMELSGSDNKQYSSN